MGAQYPDSRAAAPIMLWFECSLDLQERGAYSFGASFVVGFTRQFRFEDETGEDEGMEVVRAEFRYAVHDDFARSRGCGTRTSARPTSSGAQAAPARRNGRGGSRQAAAFRSPLSIVG